MISPSKLSSGHNCVNVMYMLVSLSLYVFMYVCMYVCMHVCIYVCMYVYIYIYIYTNIPQIPSSLLAPLLSLFLLTARVVLTVSRGGSYALD